MQTNRNKGNWTIIRRFKKDAMQSFKFIFIISFGLIFSCENIQNNEKAITTTESKNTFKVVDNPFYNSAFCEIVSMLDKKIPMDYKRAVFLLEWAYFQGTLDYNAYCSEIAEVSVKLKNFVKGKGVEQYKTSGNFALFEFFTKPNSMNGNKPFTYDFDDFNGQKDYRKTFVIKLLETHKGQCRSLPILYKILAEETKTEAFLAFAPNHLYIKHLGEDNKWVNVELTNGHFASDAYIISSMGISAEAIRNRIYMDALDLRQSIAYCLTDLSMGYQKLYGYDNFVLLCCDKTLEYFPYSMPTLLHKYNTLRSIALDYINKNGREHCAFTDSNYKDFKETQQKIESLGFREMPVEKYEEWVRAVENEKKKQQYN